MIFPVITERERKLPIYITGIGIQKDQEPTYRPNGFTDNQWIICTKGSGVLKIEGEEIIIEKGMGFYFSEGIPHSYVAIEIPWETKWVTFDGGYYRVMQPLLGMVDWGIFRPKDWMAINALFDSTYGMIRTDNLEKVVDTAGHLYQLLLCTKDNPSRQTITNRLNNRSKLQPVIQSMENNYHRYMTLSELSELIHVSPHYLCKLFNSAFGISPMHYLIRIRIQVAKGLLLTRPELTVKMIADKVCYQDTSYFCKIFKKQEMITPNQFRKLGGRTLS